MQPGGRGRGGGAGEVSGREGRREEQGEKRRLIDGGNQGDIRAAFELSFECKISWKKS